MRLIVLLITSALLISCGAKKDSHEETVERNINPEAPGFNLEYSDSTAILIADQVMEAMGGRENWDNLRYVSWNFFGARDLVWDKWEGRVRIESPRDSMIYFVNIHSLDGRVFKNNVEITEPDSLKSALLNKAKSIWINDSYWLVMPFKLKDSGVTLKYVREDTTLQGIKADVLQLTFENVGDTPQNKYEVYVDKKDKLVKQWAYFANADDTVSRVWPWDNYQDFNGVLLSSDRSDDKGPKNVAVYDNLTDEAFTSLEYSLPSADK